MGYVYNPLLKAGLDLAGLTGPPGADGTSFIIRGSVADEEALDEIEDPADGDAYLTLDTSDIYIWTGTEWLNLGQLQGPPGDNGAAGADGRTILGGSSGAPSSGDGEDGDYWIQITEGDVVLYGPKASGTWPAGISLIGPQGDQGEPGDPGAMALDDLTDVVIDGDTLDEGQVLVYDGSEWVNDTIAGGGAEALDDLSDVAIDGDTLDEGQVLVYDGTEWVNDTIAGGSATPAGSEGDIQFNDGADPAQLAASSDLNWDDTDKILGVAGDVSLDDGGSFTCTLQVVTPTADRTISLPNATGTVALVSGSSGQVAYNDAGAMVGSSALTFDTTNGLRTTLPVGYGTGAGGTVTQATSKATGVTLNTSCGTITLNNAALAADTTVTFVLTNSTIAATDMVLVSHSSVGTFGAYTLNGRAAAGSASIDVRNVSTGSLSEAIVIRFAVIKAVTA